MRGAASGRFDLLLPQQVIIEARLNLQPIRIGAFDAFLGSLNYTELAVPPADLVEANLDLVRSPKDIPIAIALLLANVDIFVTNDRDFTDPGATAPRFRERIQVMLPAVFLREVLGWSSEALEAIRNRTWDDIPSDAGD